MKTTIIILVLTLGFCFGCTRIYSEFVTLRIGEIDGVICLLNDDEDVFIALAKENPGLICLIKTWETVGSGGHSMISGLKTNSGNVVINGKKYELAESDVGKIILFKR